MLCTHTVTFKLSVLRFEPEALTQTDPRSQQRGQTGRCSAMSRAKKEILTYRAPWPVYSMSWCRGKEDYCSNYFRMAIGSFKEEYSNQVQVVQLFEEPSVSETGDRETSADPLYSFQPICQFDHPYPTTKVSPTHPLLHLSLTRNL